MEEGERGRRGRRRAHEVEVEAVAIRIWVVAEGQAPPGSPTGSLNWRLVRVHRLADVRFAAGFPDRVWRRGGSDEPRLQSETSDRPV